MTDLTASLSDDRDVRAILRQLTDGLRAALPCNLVGIYVYGSLVCGDFDATISDIDLVVVLRRALDRAQFQALDQLHQQVINDRPSWQDRLELAYISRRGLQGFRRQSCAMGIISPGEPFHIIQAGEDWLISWYALREDGLALLGPPIDSLVEAIPTSDYLRAVRAHIEAYRALDVAAADAPMLSYALLTVARGLYTLRHGSAVSKIRAAAWAQGRFPQWSQLIQLAILWRAKPPQDAPAVDKWRQSVARCVADMLDAR